MIKFILFSHEVEISKTVLKSNEEILPERLYEKVIYKLINNKEKNSNYKKPPKIWRQLHS